MFFQGQSFKTMEAGVRATWMQQQIHNQNIANYDTPHYKAKSLVFSQALTHARRGEFASRGSAPDMRVIEDETTTVRPDGNNVDMDVESLSLYKSYVHYTMLLEKIRSEIDNHNYVLANAPR